MAYDKLAESIALIATRQLTPVSKLSRRRRFAAMAVDVADDVAATMFLRRSVGCDVVEVWQLARRDDQWHMLGGGSGPTDDDGGILAPRPDMIPGEAAQWNALPGVDPRMMIGDGSGGVRDAGRRCGVFPWGRWINYVELFASARVASLRVGDRVVAVPWHGRTPVTWVGPHPLPVIVCDAEGRTMATTRLLATGR